MKRASILALLLGGAALIAGGGVAQAQGSGRVASSAQTRQLDIPAQPLSTALTIFGDQTGIQVTGDTSILDGRQSQAIRGAFSPAEGLSRMLAGTGITYRWVDGRSVALQRAPQVSSGDIQLGPVRVEGEEGAASSSSYPGGNLRGASRDEMARRLNPQTTLGSKVAVSQRELPQSVTVITQDQIQQQNMITLNDVMLNTPGVTVFPFDSDRTNFYSRGFQITTWLLDGVPTNQNLATIAPNLAMFDRVEVLRGPDGLMNGFGSPGGTINLVRKQAPDRFTINATASAGTYNNVLGEVDVGGPLNRAGTIRGLLVANAQTRDLAQDGAWRHDKLFYGTLEADITPTTLLRLGASYNQTDQKAMWTGVPVYTNYTIVPIARSTYLGAPWNHDRYKTITGFAEVKQDLDGGWSSKLSFNYLQNYSHVKIGQIFTTVDPATDQTTLDASNGFEKDQQESVDVFVTGPVHLFGRTHHLTVGASYSREDLNVINRYCSDDNPFCTVQASIFDVVNLAEPAFNGPVWNQDQAIN